ncbi:hypothetical protein VP01_659g4 [Puccinia sorghi]|uniref:polynucleotide adenylyltransferase n=1 Tax=Puccinia sorghi TaxID=27349 RepID=A0A0L6UF62_9BASI|nr:hypothetical protein VP01_659g4 [Puccinia sorghi]
MLLTQHSHQRTRLPAVLTTNIHPLLSPKKKSKRRPNTLTHHHQPKNNIISISHPHQPSLHIGSQIFKYLLLCTPGPQLIRERSRFVYQISQLITRSRIGKRPSESQPYGLQIFGSISCGLDSVDSDLDLSIMDPDRPKGLLEADCTPHKLLPKVYNVKFLAHIFTHANFKDVKPVPMACIPVLKFQSPNGLFSVDLTCNNLLACRNSQLIRAYYHLSPLVFRPLAMVIKKWAKSRGYCDPSGSRGPISASAYTLVLLLIGYLQVINHLPNLQDPQYLQHVYGNSDPDMIYIQKSRPFKSKKTAPLLMEINTSFVNSPPASFAWIQNHAITPKTDPKTLHEVVTKILIGFFEFYDRFDFQSFLISIRDGKPLRRHPPDVAQRTNQQAQSKQSWEKDGNRSTDMARLLDNLKADMSHKKIGQADEPKEEEEEEVDHITYIPFSFREGVPETLQREIDSIRLTMGRESREVASRKDSPGWATRDDESVSDSTRVSGDRARLLSVEVNERQTSLMLSLRPPQPSSVSSDCTQPPGSATDSHCSHPSLSSSSDHHDRGAYKREPTLLKWAHPMVVVDPFIYERNTAGNIKIDVLDQIRNEFSRARRILDSGGSLDDLFFAPESS